MRVNIFDLIKDRRGSILIEFAALLPVFVGLGLLSFIVSTRMRAQTRVTEAATALSDLLGANLTVGPNMMANICYGIGLIINGPGQTLPVPDTVSSPGAPPSPARAVFGSFYSVNGVATANFDQQCNGDDVTASEAAEMQAIAQSYFAVGNDKLVVSIVTYTFNSSISFGDFLTSYPIVANAALYPRNASQAPTWDPTL